MTEAKEWKEKCLTPSILSDAVQVSYFPFSTFSFSILAARRILFDEVKPQVACPIESLRLVKELKGQRKALASRPLTPRTPAHGTSFKGCGEPG